MRVETRTDPTKIGIITVVKLNASEIAALLEKGSVTMGDPAAGVTVRLEEVDDSTPDEKPKHEKKQKGWWRPIEYDLNDWVKGYKGYDRIPPQDRNPYHYHSPAPGHR